MISVNKDKCIGCGLCTDLCPEKFQLDSDGKAEAISQEVDDCATRSVDSCPASAIVIK